LVRQRRRWWGGALQVFWKTLKDPFTIGTSRAQKIDAFVYTASPILFLLSSMMFVASLVSFAAFGGALAFFTAWLYGLLGSNLLLIPLVLAETVASRERKLLWLVPGLYWYWILQIASLVSVAVQVAIFRQRVGWQRTPKLRID